MTLTRKRILGCTSQRGQENGPHLAPSLAHNGTLARHLAPCPRCSHWHLPLVFLQAQVARPPSHITMPDNLTTLSLSILHHIALEIIPTRSNNRLLVLMGKLTKCTDSTQEMSDGPTIFLAVDFLNNLPDSCRRDPRHCLLIPQLVFLTASSILQTS